MGATRSHFVNPNGLPDENHYTSVYDLYLIFQNAVQNQTFLDIISTMSYDVVYTDVNGAGVEKTWENTNQYLTGKEKAPEGITVVGGKTGTTGAPDTVWYYILTMLPGGRLSPLFKSRWKVQPLSSHE